ncbi:hypothetical protein RYX36_016494 [Vicia faba]
MEQPNQNNTPDGSGDVPQKRKRGRPRKYPRPDSAESSYMQLSQNRKQTPIRAEHAAVPPGFQTVNGNKHLQRGLESELNDAAVGQVVSGVIEAIFDAGYLLSVRVGNSDTTLRGLVFKTGRFVPVSPENDVAPGVPMIQRNEVPFPSRPTQFHTPLSKEKNGQPASASRIETLPMNGSQSVPQIPRGTVSSGNSVAASRTNVPYATGQTADQLARGNVVPILFQPSFLNGISASTSPVQITPVSLAGGMNIVGKEIPVDGNQALNSPAQTSQNLFSSSMQSEGVPSNYQSSDVLNKNADKSSVAASMPFEQLVSEGVKRIETPTNAMDTKTGNSMSGDNIAANDPSIMQVDKVNDVGQSVLVEPNSASISASQASNRTETGKMTELLQQVLRNNKTENQEAKAAEAGSGDKLDDIRSFGTGFQDGETVHSTNPF